MSITNKITASFGTLTASTDSSSPALVQDETNKLSVKLFIRNLKEVEAKSKENLINEDYISDIKLKLHGEKEGQSMKYNGDRYNIILKEQVHAKDSIVITVTKKDCNSKDIN